MPNQNYLVGGYDNATGKQLISKTFNAATINAANALAILDADWILLGINAANTRGIIVYDTTITSALDSATETTVAAMTADMAQLMDEIDDPSNSSTTILGGAGNFPGAFISLDGYTGIHVSVRTDQDSAALGLKIKFSDDGVNEILDARFSFAVTSANGFIEQIPRRGLYYRIDYTNGAIAQTQFALIARKLPRLASLGTDNIPVIISGSGLTVTANAGTNLNTSLLALESGGNLAALKDIAHVINTALVRAAAIAGQFDDIAPTVATENNIAPIRITPYRGVHANLRDNNGNELSFGFGNNQRLKVSLSTNLILDPIKGGALNTNVWLSSVSTMTIAQSPGMLTLNSATSLAANAYAIITSIKKPLQYGDFPLVARFRGLAKPQTNAVIEFGFGNVATNAAPTDGAFFRWDSTGALKGVINNGGTETLTAAFTALDPTKYYEFTIYLYQNRVRLIIELDNAIAADVTLLPPATQATMNAVGSIPVFARVYNTGVAPTTAPQLIIGLTTVDLIDVASNKSWALQRTENAKGSYQKVLTPFDQEANFANSTVPATATLLNTAASYTTLGGLFAFAAVLGAETDFCLFGFQVGTGGQLIITGIDISCALTGADIGASGTVLQWGIGLNSSAVSLATAEAPPTTYAPRRIALGMMGWNSSGEIGDVKELSRNFSDSPLVVDSGRFLQIILRIPAGLATALQLFRGACTIRGFSE